MAIDRSREIDADGRRRDAMLDPRTDRRQRARNVVQSTLLLSSLLVVVAGIGWLLFAAAGLLWAVVLATVLLTLRPQIPPRLVLALYRAEPLPVAVAPDLHRLVGELAARAGLHHAPALYYVPSAALNCFCLGHGEDAALAVTDGLLRRLTYREVAGVLAHEVGHLRAGDPAVMSLSDAIGRLCQTLALLGLLVVPVAAVLALTATRVCCCSALRWSPSRSRSPSCSWRCSGPGSSRPTSPRLG